MRSPACNFNTIEGGSGPLLCPGAQPWPAPDPDPPQRLIYRRFVADFFAAFLTGRFTAFFAAFFFALAIFIPLSFHPNQFGTLEY
jgi:hypothetical protein